MSKATRYASKYPSFGFQGKHWDRKDIETIVTPEELKEQRDLGYGAKDPKDDKSALKHFQPLEAEEHGEVTMNEAANRSQETANRVMGLPDPDHPVEEQILPTSGSVITDQAPGRSAPGLSQSSKDDLKNKGHKK